MTNNARVPGGRASHDRVVGLGAESGLHFEEVHSLCEQPRDSRVRIAGRQDAHERGVLIARAVEKRSRRQDPRAFQRAVLHPISQAEHAIERTAHVADADHAIGEEERQHRALGKLGFRAHGEVDVHVPETWHQELAFAVDDGGAGGNRGRRIDDPVDGVTSQHHGAGPRRRARRVDHRCAGDDGHGWPLR